MSEALDTLAESTYLSPSCRNRGGTTETITGLVTTMSPEATPLRIDLSCANTATLYVETFPEVLKVKVAVLSSPGWRKGMKARVLLKSSLIYWSAGADTDAMENGMASSTAISPAAGAGAAKSATSLFPAAVLALDRKKPRPVLPGCENILT